MSSIRCSKTTALLWVAVLLASAVGTASAFTVSESGLPEESRVGEEVSVTYTIDDPFTDVPGEWTLRGSTELRNVSWTVTVLRAGTRQSQDTYGDQSFQQDLDVDEGGDEVRIQLVGTTPPVENYSYEPPQSYVAASLERVAGNNANEFQNSTVHHYTSESDQARNAIDSAQSAIDDAGGHQGAESDVESAVSAYENENFGLAERLANDAQSQAEGAQQNQQLLMIGAGVLVLLLLVGLIVGGYYYWKSQQEEYSAL